MFTERGQTFAQSFYKSAERFIPAKQRPDRKICKIGEIFVRFVLDITTKLLLTVKIHLIMMMVS